MRIEIDREVSFFQGLTYFETGLPTFEAARQLIRVVIYI